MQTDKLFSTIIAYLKIATIFGMIMCLFLMPFKSFDPMGADGLEGMIMHDLYGSKNMPAEARPAFDLGFLLFDMLSVLTLAGQYLVIKHGLAQQQKWAFHYMLLIGFVWPLGAAGVALHTGAYSYLYSAGIMAVLFTTPVLLLWKYFR